MIDSEYIEITFIWYRTAKQADHRKSTSLKDLRITERTNGGFEGFDERKNEIAK